MTAGVVYLISKNAQEHSTIENGADTIKDFVELRGWDEAAATAKVHEIFGATLEPEGEAD